MCFFDLCVSLSSLRTCVCAHEVTYTCVCLWYTPMFLFRRHTFGPSLWSCLLSGRLWNLHPKVGGLDPLSSKDNNFGGPDVVNNIVGVVYFRYLMTMEQ